MAATISYDCVLKDFERNYDITSKAFLIYGRITN